MREYEKQPKWSCIMPCKRQPGLLGYLIEDYRVKSCIDALEWKKAMHGAQKPGDVFEATEVLKR